MPGWTKCRSTKRDKSLVSPGNSGQGLGRTWSHALSNIELTVFRLGTQEGYWTWHKARNHEFIVCRNRPCVLAGQSSVQTSVWHIHRQTLRSLAVTHSLVHMDRLLMIAMVSQMSSSLRLQTAMSFQLQWSYRRPWELIHSVMPWSGSTFGRNVP